jgi:hypothetical protein
MAGGTVDNSLGLGGSASSGGFSAVPEAVDPGAALSAAANFTAEQTAFHGEEYSDETALGIVLTDVSAGIAFLQSKALLPALVDTSNDLIFGLQKPRVWADGKPRANLPIYAVMEGIEKLMPVFYMSLFGTGKRRPFVVTPVGKTTPEAARAKGSVLAWAVKQAGLKEEMRLTLKQCLSYGFCCGWWGWEQKNLRERVYAKNSSGKVSGKWKDILLSLPKFENVDLKNFSFDPQCKRQDVQKGARWVGKQVLITANTLDDWRDDLDTYGRDEVEEIEQDGQKVSKKTGKRVSRIPDRETLRRVLATDREQTEDTFASQKRAIWREFQAQLDTEASSVDPLMRPLEYIEYWTEDHIIGVLQRKLVIRLSENEYNETPARTCAFIDVLGSAWGFGVARLLAGEQRFQAGVANSWIDSLALVLNPVFQALKGVGPGTQNIPLAPGRVITETSELKPLVTPDVSQAATTAMANSEARASKRIGAEGGVNLPTQALRTGSGVQALTGDVIQRLQYFLEIFINLVYLPTLEKFVLLCMEHLQPDDINRILTEEEGKEWTGNIEEVYNAQIGIDVLAGADLTARAASAQLAPIIIQLLSAPAVQTSLQIQGRKFDYTNWAADMLDSQGFDVDHYFQPMTPDDLKRMQEQNAAYAKGQQDQAVEAQKHQNDLDAINEKGTVQAGVALVKKAAESHMDVAQNALELLQQQQQPSEPPQQITG